MATNQGFKSFVPKPGKLEAGYLYHWLRANKERLQRMGNGATFKEVSKAVVSRIEIPLPPIEEQRRIAGILDKAEALRAKRREAIARLDTLAQSIFIEMFGDSVTNPKQFPTHSLGQVAGIIVPTRDKPKSFTGSIPWVTLPDLEDVYVGDSRNRLTEQEAREVGNRLIPQDSVLLSCAGTLGRVGITSVPLFANQQFYALIPNNEVLDSAYLAFCLRLKGEDFFKRLSGTFTIGFFSKDKALAVPIALPPMRDQECFHSRIDAVESTKSEFKRSRLTADALFTSLQQRAFRGEL